MDKTSIYIKKAIEKHGNAYDYSLVIFEHSRTNIKIICKRCGITFEQRPDKHLCGRGCKDCAFDKRRFTKEIFVVNAIKIHGNKYDYSLVEYINAHTPVTMICKTCSEHFIIAPNHHCNHRQGCNNCSSLLMSEKLTKKFIEGFTNHIFRKAKPSWLNYMELDMYSKDLGLAIEYQGRQHYIHVPFFHKTIELFEAQRERDKRKKQLCQDNNVILIEIPYKYNCQNPNNLREYVFTQLSKTIDENPELALSLYLF